MLQVGLLGAGRITGAHARSISARPGARLTAVAAMVTKAAETLAAPHADQAQGTDDSLAEPSIDAVLIAKPASFFLEGDTAAFGAEREAFIIAVEVGTPPPAPLADATTSLALAKAATRSTLRGAPVMMSGAA